MTASHTWVVTSHEVKRYFDQPIAYVLLVALSGVTIFLGFRSLFTSGVASLRPLFDWLPVLCAVFVPAVTMRTLAEEHRQRTLQWLLAQPVTEAEVVVGKFAGCWFVVLVALSTTLPLAVGLLASSPVDPGILIAQYSGAGFLALQFVALGLWTSAVCRHQVTAFVLASTFAFLLILIGLPIVQVALPPPLSSAAMQLSVLTHFEGVARGVVDVRDALYFLSTTIAFLALAVAAMSRHRLSPVRGEYRRLRSGVGVAIASMFVLNLLGSHIDGRIDLTRDRVFTLAEGTRDLLSSLDDRVNVTLYVSSELPPELRTQLRDIRDLLADMEQVSDGRLRVRVVDPDQDEDAAEEASAMGVRRVEFNVLRKDEFKVRNGFLGITVTYLDHWRVMPVVDRTEDLEFRMASAIASITADRKPVVAFDSHYSVLRPNEAPRLRETLSDRYALVSLDLAADSSDLRRALDSTHVVVLSPTSRVDGATVERIRSYLRTGGSVLALLEPVVFQETSPVPLPVASGLNPLLEEYGVRFRGELLFDLESHERLPLGTERGSSVVLPYPLWPVAVPTGTNAVTRNMSTLTLGWAGALELRDSSRMVPLMRTTRAAGLRDPDLPITPDQEWELPGQYLREHVVAIATRPVTAEDGGDTLPGRMVIVSDASFMDDQFLRMNRENLVFFANALDWLTQDDALVRIRSKDRIPPRLVLVSDVARIGWKWGSLLGVPLLFVLWGAARISGRRRRAEARWNGWSE